MAKKRGAKKKNHKPTETQETSNPTPEEEEEKKKMIFPISNLPPGLLLDLLYRFYAKSLLQLRCFSRFWLALIDNPIFRQNHVINFNSPRNRQLICNSFHDKGRRKLVAFLSAQGSYTPVLDVDLHFSDRPNYPRRINFKDFSKNMVLAGSINGIVCLAHSKEMCGRFVALWNPTIRYWKPIALPQTRAWECVSVGLGFDMVMNDFKIICIVPFLDTEGAGWSRIEIYSANQNSWENVDEERIVRFVPVHHRQNCKFIVQGVPYWVGKEALAQTNLVLGRIDPSTGMYRTVLFPEHIRNECTEVHAVNLKGSIAALIQSPGEHPNNMVALYVLDEDTADWRMMYNIGPLEFKFRRPIQCLNTGEIVLETWAGFIDKAANAVHHFYDPRTNHVFYNKEIEVLNPCWSESYIHIESLVRLEGMVEIAKEHITRRNNPRMDNWNEYVSEELEAALHR
ncbi:hypothetical protein ACET3Z_015742 [Daucus carota]